MCGFLLHLFQYFIEFKELNRLDYNNNKSYTFPCFNSIAPTHMLLWIDFVKALLPSKKSLGISKNTKNILIVIIIYYGLQL